MPNMEKISQARVNFDKFIDYVPVASAINCAVDLVQKKVFKHKANNNQELSTYQVHIEEKRVKKCLIYMIPFAKLIDKLRMAIQVRRHGWAPANSTLPIPKDVEFLRELTKFLITKPTVQQLLTFLLLERMEVNADAYYYLIELDLVKEIGKYPEDMTQSSGELDLACYYFKDKFLDHLTEEGHENDQAYFTAFVEAAAALDGAHPDTKARMLSLIE